VEADLREAKPELDAAKDALAKLDKNKVIELKTFSNPHESIVLVLEAVMVLFGEKTDWNSAR
jgi:dynein heavy chain